MPLKHPHNLQSISTCPCCSRQVALTFHHLIPRKLHRRNGFKRRFNKAQLNEGIYICRLCHDGIHQQYSEMQLAKSFTTLEALLADASLSRHFQWVAKQKVNTRS